MLQNSPFEQREHGWWAHKLHKHYFFLILHTFLFFHNKQRKEEKPNKMKSPEVSPGTWCSAGLMLFWGPQMQSEEMRQFWHPTVRHQLRCGYKRVIVDFCIRKVGWIMLEELLFWVFLWQLAFWAFLLSALIQALWVWELHRNKQGTGCQGLCSSLCELWEALLDHKLSIKIPIERNVA